MNEFGVCLVIIQINIISCVSKGADVTIPDNRGRTPLHLAAAESDCQTVRYLISKGSEINARDNAGETAIFDAVRCK